MPSTYPVVPSSATLFLFKPFFVHLDPLGQAPYGSGFGRTEMGPCRSSVTTCLASNLFEPRQCFPSQILDTEYIIVIHVITAPLGPNSDAGSLDTCLDESLTVPNEYKFLGTQDNAARRVM